MIVEDQAEVIAFLSDAATHGGNDVERVETHAAVVFLAGSTVYKLKRAVRFDYLDFSTADRRRASCEAEVRVNRRTAPALYRGVVAVTREPGGGLALGGSGAAVDWLVEMQRFDQALLLDRLAGRQALSLDVMLPLARSVADLHRGAEPRPDHGGRDGMAWVIDGNAAGFAEFARVGLDEAMAARVTEASRRELDRTADLLEARRRDGLVRACHGDLHLRNLVLLDGRPTLFDGVEFNDAISCIDVMYDLAFLVMDLWRRRLPQHANAVLNGYLAETADLEGLRLLPLFLSCRAAVRAKTSATVAQMHDDESRRDEARALAGRYLAMAEAFLQPPAPCLAAIGGLSGTGKSTVARALAPAVGGAPGAVILRSDEVRKRLHGVAPQAHLAPDAYTPEASARVYDALVAQARTVVQAGHAAVVDAVHAQPAQRTAVERAAREARVPFAGFWLSAPEALLVARVQTRTGDASDADAAVVREQLRQDPGPMTWVTLDAAQPADRVVAAALERIDPRCRGQTVPA